MASTDLLFGRAPVTGTSIDLLFNDDGLTAIDSLVLVQGELPSLGGVVNLALPQLLDVVGELPGLSGVATVVYNSDTSRPTVNDITAAFETAGSTRTGIRATWQEARQQPAQYRSVFQEASVLSEGLRVRWDEAGRQPASRAVRYQEAIRLGTPTTRTGFMDSGRLRAGGRVRYQEATRLGTQPRRGRYQEADRTPRNLAAARSQSAKGHFASVSEIEGYGVGFSADIASRYQDARKPPIGKWDFTVVVPPGSTCYTPPAGNDVALLFADAWSSDTGLLFVCEKHSGGGGDGQTVVVPVREVYLTVNSAVLVRVDNGFIIPTTSMSMSLDVDSWTWTFSASVPGAALDAVRPVDGEPVVVQATINSVPFRFAIESVSRERSYNKSSLSVRGRGLAAELDAPYAPTMNFGNTGARTARQLLDDILTFNGVPLDWTIDTFAPDDWNVPAGVFSHKGTYISAINTVAAAAGAYVQPDNTAKKLNVLLRYPTPSWAWADVTPDFELPAAVTSQEGIEWAYKPEYNRVYVSGQDSGVNVRYTRAGTAGDFLADGVVDPLITAAVAGRQRGRSILSATGSIATVSLKLPVLAETGIIKPGKFVRYVDGSTTRLGLTRSVSVDVGLPTIYQTLSVETHE